MSRVGFTLAIAAAFVGCTATSTLPRPRSTEALQALIWETRSNVTLLYEEPEATTSPAPSLVPVPAAVDGRTGALAAGVPNLRGIDVKRRGLGRLEGSTVGVAVGFVAGTLLGMAVMSDDPPCDDPHLCLRVLGWEKAVFIGTLGAIAGLVLGGQIGADIGHTHRYLFVNE